MKLITDSVQLLNDAKFYLTQISEADYTSSIAILSEATIGQHTRHYIEFYHCLMEQSIDKTVNYDKRKRDVNIELLPCSAIHELSRIQAWLQQHPTDCSLNVEFGLDGNGETHKSSLYREMLNCFEHCIHHLAMIKIGILAQQSAIEIPENFGVAPSTIAYNDISCS